MRLRTAHQFHPTLAHGDAVGNDCFELQRLLWRWGVRSELFAEVALPEVSGLVRNWRDLATDPADGALLFLHHSMGNAAVDEVARLPTRKALVYHNITPAHFFSGLNEEARHWSEVGRQQLRALASSCDLGIADSEFNRRELEVLGYARTAVVPIIVDWTAFEAAPDPEVSRHLADERATILVVGQILPQKAVHDVIAGFAAYRARQRDARLVLVGGTTMSGAYLGTLQAQVREAGLSEAVTFAGSVPMEQLVAYYRGATALLTLSDHEGFCVPLLEAMRSDLPIVAHAAGAIPDTLGDAGILLERKSPDDVAAALERVVGDEALRRDLVARGRRRLEEFTPERVGQRLRDALAQAGWAAPLERYRRLAVVSSDQRCGVHDYSQAVSKGLRANGHEVTFVGVRHLDSADLRRKMRYISPSTEAVVIEHEAGIFRDVPFVLALLGLRRRGIRVILSLHELEPEKFHHYRMLTRALHYRPRFAWPLEVLRAPYVALRIANWFVRYRAVLGLMGALPSRVIVHSHRSNHFLDLVTADPHKRDHFPLLLMPLEDAVPPRDEEEKRALRRELGLPEDRFIFVSPGFFFRRKRYVEVLAAAPADALVVLSGTRSDREPEYFDEVAAYVRDQDLRNVIVNTDYDAMGRYVAASDAVVLYYEDVFQSAVATQAVWAGLPCVFSDARGFALYRGAGLVARSDAELASAMREIRRPETYARLRRQVGVLRHLLSPERNAPRYLVGLE